MEDSRLHIALNAGTFTDIYQRLSVTIGTKLAIQNQSPSYITVCIGATASDNRGFVIEPFGYYIVPAGSSGCFLKANTQISATVSVQLGGWSIPDSPIDERVYNGLKALTIQPFIEANVKNGSQWEFSFESTSVPAGASLDLIFTAGTEYVLIKNRQLVFTGSGIEVSVYKSPVYSSGTNLKIFNLNTAYTLDPKSTVKINTTINSPGTEIAAKNYAYGSASNVNHTVGTFQTTGMERVLLPGVSYLPRITNRDTASARISGYVSFYEGEISSLN